MKRTIEIDDTLHDRLDSVKTDIREDFRSWLKENPDSEDFDDYWQSSGADTHHEIVDAATPIYTKEIDDTYYLYGNELDEAYENAGLGDGKEDNYKQVAIYCWLEQESASVFDELREGLEEFVEAKADLIAYQEWLDDKDKEAEFWAFRSDKAEASLYDLGERPVAPDGVLNPFLIDWLINNIFKGN